MDIEPHSSRINSKQNKRTPKPTSNAPYITLRELKFKEKDKMPASQNQTSRFGDRDEIRLATVIIGENMFVASLQVVFPFFVLKTFSIFEK